ncbi:MAG: FG-GAP-like repeat-containing protein [bacterium]
MFLFKASLKPPYKIFLALTAAFFYCANLSAQNFVKITDTNNPIVTDVFTGSYFGSSWIDINNDRLLDLYVNRKAIYKNLGGGNFVQLESALGPQAPTLSNTWADYNNDGFIDGFLTSTFGPNSFLFKNNGVGSFIKIRAGEIGDSVFNTGWGCAMADYDNDGYTDLIIVAANNFGTVNHPNRLYHNNGDETFSRINFPGLTDTLAPFTIPTWSDYDQDGDMDLFIGTGPGGSPGLDNLYKNTLIETGTAALVRLNLAPLSTDLQDGQVWNLIDYDNDGDLDAFLTNYSSVPNRLYKNNNGVYERMTEAQVGTIVSDVGSYLTNLWGDFDNDGDLDCFETRDVPLQSRYYNNNGNGTFTRKDSLSVVINSGGNFGATAGDYDNNGSLDLYVTGSTVSKGLFRNDLTNGNKWINIKCNGGGAMSNLSNKSAIGAKVKVKATINGIPTWQYREVLAQNSFNSMNMLNVHFGLGNAAVIDSLVIIWPRGLKEVTRNVIVNTFYNAVEGQGIVSGILNGSDILPSKFDLAQNYPNPFNPATVISYRLNVSGHIMLKVYNVLGKEVATLINKLQPAGSYEVTFEAEGLSSGTYFYKLTAGNFSETKTMALIR